MVRHKYRTQQHQTASIQQSSSFWTTIDYCPYFFLPFKFSQSHSCSVLTAASTISFIERQCLLLWQQRLGDTWVLSRSSEDLSDTSFMERLFKVVNKANNNSSLLCLPLCVNHMSDFINALKCFKLVFRLLPLADEDYTSPWMCVCLSSIFCQLHTMQYIHCRTNKGSNLFLKTFLWNWKSTFPGGWLNSYWCQVNDIVFRETPQCNEAVR